MTSPGQDLRQAIKRAVAAREAVRATAAELAARKREESEQERAERPFSIERRGE